MLIDVHGLSAGALVLHTQFFVRPNKHGKILIAVLLFVIVFLVLGTAVDQIWFREDDLGTILNGLVTSWENFVKVFATDVRDFICPVNYHRSAPNVLSGFLRPLQHFLFTIEYYLFGDVAYPYFLVHVGLHACNAVLLYIIGLWFFPAWLAFFAGLFFALYPDVSWLTWIATAQNTLCTLFLLLTIIFWKRSWSLLAGFMFFLSLLARENVVTMPIWFFAGAWLFLTTASQNWLQRLRVSWLASWTFFAAVAGYWMIRLWAFGLGTLSRTLSNVLLRFPVLAQLFNVSNQHVVQTSSTTSAVTGTMHIVCSTPLLSVTDYVLQTFARCSKFFTAWLSSVLMVDLSSSQAIIIALLFFLLVTIFLLCTYGDEHKKEFFFLLLGIVLMSWPALVAYPCPRYLNTIYPVIALLLVGGCFLAFEQKQKWLRSAAWCMIIVMGVGIARGVLHNRQLLHDGAAARAEYKRRFDLFFKENKFKPATKFVVFNSPFVSDIQSIFQTYLHDSSIEVAHEPFATLAEQGIFGCSKPYRIENVASHLEPIEGGFRFISDDPEHCAWWIHFSDHPLAWSEKDRAYIWSDQPYQEHVWYECSLGKFKINRMLDDRYLIDVSFIFDKKWITQSTVFVVWNTRLGRYIVLGKSNLSA